MIRRVKGGQTSRESDRCYGVKSGVTRAGEKLYIAKNGKTRLCWVRPGSRSMPYRIYTADDLKMVKEDPNGYYLLMRDIALPRGEQDYLPILEDVPFTGVFDGQGYKLYTQRKAASDKTAVDMKNKRFTETIQGNTINVTAYALFGINSGIITRLNLNELNIDFVNDGADYAGGAVAINRGILDRVYADSTNVDIAGWYFGRVAAINTGTIQSCTGDTFLKNGNYRRGGIVYSNYGVIDHCRGHVYATQDVWVSQMGLIAYKNFKGGTIKNCYYNARFESYAKAVMANDGEMIDTEFESVQNPFQKPGNDYVIY